LWDFVEAGDLISYGANFPNLWRRAADFVDKILHGAKPADISVEQPTKFDLVVNLTTAKALGLTVLPTLLARAVAIFVGLWVGHGAQRGNHCSDRGRSRDWHCRVCKISHRPLSGPLPARSLAAHGRQGLT
jgi:ABC transporter substrate binding protein